MSDTVTHQRVFEEAQRIVKDALWVMPTDVLTYLGRARGVLHMAGMLLPEDYDQRLHELSVAIDKRERECRG